MMRARVARALAELESARVVYQQALDIARDSGSDSSNRALEAAYRDLARAEDFVVIARLADRFDRVAVDESIRDVKGFNLRPDPLQAQTAIELVAALRRFRIWAGEPSYREMARRNNHQVGASTLCGALNSKVLPRLNLVLAIIVGCGGNEDDLQSFATAWRTVRLKEETAKSGVADPILRLLPSSDEAG